jgi:hypothetical protein
MVRLITCQQATLLVEKRHDHALSLAQRAGLWMHLHYCRHCSRYARQTVLVAQLARHAALGHEHASVSLPAPARQRIRERMAEAI